ncbi:MAG TPA: hypothetical protein VFQ91_16065 [Bryobacteraceae bacterium]|nr:hypothetical protein [Bryobacteraceae bacterium]
MKHLLLLAFAALSLQAQASRVQGHAFFGLDNPPRGSFGNGSVGAGADVFLYKGAAFSPSLGYLFDYDGGGVAVATVNGSYHFLRGKGRFQPFVSAGYGALANLGGGISLYNFGGGATYWFHKRLGFRAEVVNWQNNSHRELTSLRFALSFR